LVSREKLAQLLDEQHESESLDYKATCDLRERRDIVELAKDVAAMQMEGGFIVVGADDQGNPTGRLTREQAQLLDEATVRAKLDAYIPEPYELRVAVHEVEASLCAVIYVGPNTRGWCIFKRDGTYQRPDGRQVTIFRAGEVFARHGTASERWRQEDIDRILRRLIDREREAWRRGLAEDLQHVAAASRAQNLAGGPAAGLTWKVDADTFIETVVEQLRQEDDIPLRLLLSRSGAEVGSLMAEEGGAAEIGILLDRLACLAAVLLLVERRGLFDRVVSALVAIYDQGFGEEGHPKRGTRVTPEHLWLMVVERVVALGGLAVRREDWRAVQSLARQRGHGRDFDPGGLGYPSWLRHALTMAARAELLRQEHGGRVVEASLLSLALSHIRRNPCLRPDLPEDDERVLDSLCQFDALAALVAIGEAGGVGTRVFYPNFARFYSHRTEPAIVRVIEDREMREVIFALDDESLAVALRALNDRASQEGWRFAGWDGFLNPRISAFLDDHPPRDHDQG